MNFTFTFLILVFTRCIVFLRNMVQKKVTEDVQNDVSEINEK